MDVEEQKIASRYVFPFLRFPFSTFSSCFEAGFQSPAQIGAFVAGRRPNGVEPSVPRETR